MTDDGELRRETLEAVRSACASDETLRKFLVDLLCEEAEHPGNWRWKEPYTQRIAETATEWAKQNED